MPCIVNVTDELWFLTVTLLVAHAPLASVVQLTLPEAPPLTVSVAFAPDTALPPASCTVTSALACQFFFACEVLVPVSPAKCTAIEAGGGVAPPVMNPV